MATPAVGEDIEALCGKCGTVGTFVKKQGMRFITLFFIIPVLPISGIKNLLQCSVCGTKYQTKS